MTLAPAASDDLVLWDVVEEHLDESAFLFDQWNRALYLPAYTLKQSKATLEARLEAHLDALTVGGPGVSTRVLYPELENEEPARATVAALALLASQEVSGAARILAALQSDECKSRSALIRALVLSHLDMDALLLERFGEPCSDAYRAVLLEILTGRGIDPSDQLRLCLHTQDLTLVRAALKAVHRFGRRELLDWAEGHLAADDPLVQIDAIEACLALGSARAWQVCLELVNTSETTSPHILALAAMLGQPSDHQALFQQFDDPAGTVTLLWTLGFSGTLQAGDTCVRYLDSKDQRVAKAAADSLAWIAGLELKDARFSAAAIETEKDTLPALEDDDLDADLESDGVGALPVPNPAAIAQWWENNRPRFAQHPRWVLGQPFSPAAVIRALEAGPLWRRHLLALELSIRTKGQRHVATDSFSQRQLREMAGLAGMSFTG